MVEALLFGVPSIAVTNWMIPTVENEPPNPPSIPYDFVLKTTKEYLRETVDDVLKNEHEIEYRGETLSLETYSDLWFSRRSGSAKMTMDIIEETLAGRRSEYDNVLEQEGYDGKGEATLTLGYRIRRIGNR